MSDSLKSTTVTSNGISLKSYKAVKAATVITNNKKIIQHVCTVTLLSQSFNQPRLFQAAMAHMRKTHHHINQYCYVLRFLAAAFVARAECKFVVVSITVVSKTGKMIFPSDDVMVSSSGHVMRANEPVSSAERKISPAVLSDDALSRRPLRQRQNQAT